MVVLYQPALCSHDRVAGAPMVPHVSVKSPPCL